MDTRGEGAIGPAWSGTPDQAGPSSTLTKPHSKLSCRPMQETERSYVISTWLRSYWSTAKGREFRGRPEAQYLRTYDERIKAALASGTHVVVGVDLEFPRVVVGWAAHTGTTLHYLYVRAPFRRQHVARELLATAPKLWCHSHVTPDFLRLAKAMGWLSVHRPNHFHEDNNRAQPRGVKP